MAERKIWVSTGRDDKNHTILHYGPKDSSGVITPQGAVTVNHNDGSRSRWTGAGDSKGTGDDLQQSMLAVETFARLADEGIL